MGYQWMYAHAPEHERAEHYAHYRDIRTEINDRLLAKGFRTIDEHKKIQREIDRMYKARMGYLSMVY